jgi:exodeoxyribonuclease V alpha subunit
MFGTGYRSVAARLARDIRGIGFKTADAIAMKLGIEKTAMIRVRAGVSYALTEAMDEGHCGLPADDELVPLAEKLLEVPRNWSAPPLISS